MAYSMDSPPVSQVPHGSPWLQIAKANLDANLPGFGYKVLGLIGDGGRRTDGTIWDMPSGRTGRRQLEIIAGNVFLKDTERSFKIKDFAQHLPGALIGYNLAAFWWHLVEISSDVFLMYLENGRIRWTLLSLRSCT